MARDAPPASTSNAPPTPSQLPYDQMDPREVRQLRSEYRNVLSTQAETRANLSAIDVKDLKSNLDQVATLFGGVKRAQEATLDSKAVTNLSEMAALKARAMKHSTGGFDVDDFLAKLVTFMSAREGDTGGDDDDDDESNAMLDWEKMSYLALSKSRRVPGVNFMLGPLSIEAKKKTTTKRANNRLKKDAKDRVVVEEADVKQEPEGTDKGTAAMVAQLTELLPHQNEPINYFRFVINPHSFEQSVENIFYFAFLIKEGAAAWELTDEGEPMIYACMAASQEEFADGFRKRQAVVEFDMETWKRAIEVFDIRKSIIPHRASIPLDQKFPNFKGNGKGRSSAPVESDSDAPPEGDDDDEEDEDED